MKNLGIYTLDELQKKDITDLVGIHKYYYDYNLNLILDFKNEVFSTLDFLQFKNKFFIDYSQRLFRSSLIKMIFNLEIVSFNHFILINNFLLGGIN